MSHTAIKNNINRLLKERSWKVADIENKIGHGRPVKNILSGSSKNPTIEILKLIAHAFNVEIQDLLIEQENIQSVNLPLLSDTYTKVIQEIETLSKSITFTHNNVTLLVKETYEYSLKLTLNSADINFIKWLIQKHYS
jgi:transcriptional regulator with XRE-family HTH domain